jgi:uncharacterized protein (UPF0548 family)
MIHLAATMGAEARAEWDQALATHEALIEARVAARQVYLRAQLDYKEARGAWQRSRDQLRDLRQQQDVVIDQMTTAEAEAFRAAYAGEES